MGVVLVDLTLAIGIFVVVGSLIVRASRRDDKRFAKEAQKTFDDAKRKVDLDKKRFQSGVELVCLNCDKQFSGPLTDDGCPSCHTSSLVITQEEFNNASKNTNQQTL